MQNYTQSNYTQSNASFFDSEITKISLRLTPPAPVAGRSLAAPGGGQRAGLGVGGAGSWGVASLGCRSLEDGRPAHGLRDCRLARGAAAVGMRFCLGAGWPVLGADSAGGEGKSVEITFWSWGKRGGRASVGMEF